MALCEMDGMENRYRYRIDNLKDSNYYESLVGEHREILSAIEKGDKETTRTCMRSHIDNQQFAVIKMLK
jgi:DNA-binding FadR family transcriptional regulator